MSSLIVVMLAVGCSNVLGYDELTFQDGGAGASASGGTSSGGSSSGGSSGSGGASVGGNSGAGGAPSGGASSGGTPGSGGAATGGASSGGSSGSGGSATGGASSGGASSGGTSGSGGSATGGSGGGTTTDPFATARQQCVDKINEYRATLSLPPYQRWNAKESCADGEAKSDSETGQAHGAFPSCGEWAQNECPGYPSVSSTVTTCLAQMWAEGPGADFQTHGHYINMSSTKYTKVACGFYQTPGGSVWAVQDFQ